MNGGVSLAVWMSGVTLEIDRLRRHDGVYGQLLDLVHATARVDVIAGASAGGLAGTLLGLAVATESEVSDARDLWIDRGSIADMLRDPFEADPPSLLRGDDYFLARVWDALETIRRKAGRHPTGGEDAAPDVRGHDLHVIVTTTTLTGETKGFPDRFGTVIRDFDHRQAFHFKRTSNPPENDFDVDDGAMLARLALAGRTTSSFPGAFEPSFIPVGRETDGLHPSMEPVASFQSDRWAVDGGVLVNTPFGRALDVIRTLPAEREVRRVLVYIVASAGTSLDTEPDPRVEMPTLRDVVLDSLSDLPRVQSFADELAQIEETNRRAEERRKARRELLTQLGNEGLVETAEKLLPAYVSARSASAVADVTRTVVDSVVQAAPAEVSTPTVDPSAVEAALPTAEQPWLPEAEAASLAVTPDARWHWGIAPVEYAANVVLDLLREGLTLAEPPGLRPELRRLRGEAHDQLARLRALQNRGDAFWAERAAEMHVGATESQELLGDWREEHAEDAGDIAFELGRIAAAAAAAIPDPAAGAEPSEAVQLARALVPRTAADPVAAAVQSLLALHVVQRAAGSELSGIEQAVELVQLSANTPNSFDPRERANQKLAGLQLHHFGAFYKRSWRANDWLWGRLDGATRLVQIVLDPARLERRVREGELSGSAEVAARIVESALSVAETDEEREFLAARWKVEDLTEELAFLDRSEVPPRLPRCWDVLATALQWRILRDELDTVRKAAKADVDADCLETASGAVWARGIPDGPATPAETVARFVGCSIGEEKIAAEVGTDYFTRLVSRASAVSGSILRGKHSGLPGPLRKLATFVRGILIALYLLARGVTSRGRTGPFLVALALASGGALLALAIVASPPAFLTALGATMVLAGFALALLRGGERWLAVWAAVAIVAIVVGAYVVERFDLDEKLPDSLEGLAPAVPILALALLTALLGLIKRRPREPGTSGG
jgi:patatin-related protein